MFDADTLAEVWSTLSRHKLRTALTAFSVAWGVFMLIILLGAGRGLENGATDGFQGDALNAIWVNTGTTALPYRRAKPGAQDQTRQLGLHRVCSGCAPPGSNTSAASSIWRGASW